MNVVGKGPRPFSHRTLDAKPAVKEVSAGAGTKCAGLRQGTTSLERQALNVSIRLSDPSKATSLRRYNTVLCGVDV
jgi:hypothetical protein